MASIATNLFNKKIERQPKFEFMVKSDDFYINTHGVSVTESPKSYTSYNNGLFHILNKNNRPLYFGDVTISNVKLRNENGYPDSLISYTKENDIISDNTLTEVYKLKFRNQIIGELKIIRPTPYTNGSGLIIQPFQSISFSAVYTVINLNNLNLQYYGKSDLRPTQKKGVIDFNFTITTYSDKLLNNKITEQLTITVNTINSGYVAASIEQEPQDNS